MKVIKDSKNMSKVAKAESVIEQMEREWPEMTQEFKKIQREQYELFLHKQHDYGPGNISVGTQLQTEDEVHLNQVPLSFWVRFPISGKFLLILTYHLH